MARRILIALFLLASSAMAADVKVGQTVEVDVGFRRGLVCDDTSIVDASIVTDTKANTNKVILRGLKVGKTMCRAGGIKGDPLAPMIFEVQVNPK